MQGQTPSQRGSVSCSVRLAACLPYTGVGEGTHTGGRKVCDVGHHAADEGDWHEDDVAGVQNIPLVFGEVPAGDK